MKKIIDIKQFWILTVIVLVLVVPVCAVKVNEVLTDLKPVSVDEPVANNMNISLHSNTNFDGKLNSRNAKNYTITTAPKHGKLTLTKNGNFRYVPNQNFTGQDTFKYRVNNGKINSNTATVTININNQAPTTINTSLNTYKNTVNCGVLTATDPDNDQLVYSVVTPPINGILTITTDGRYTYTPNKGFMGTDSFTYKVNDGITSSNIANVTINVENEAPIAKNSSFNAHFTNGKKVYTGDLDVTDPDNDRLSYTILSEPAYGILTLNDDGEYTYTPNTNFIGVDSFTYKVNDGTIDSNIANVTINLENEQPIAANTTVTKFNTQDGSAYIGIFNVKDLDNDTLTYKIISKPSNGTVLVKDDGTYVYIPNTKFRGSDSFTYVANDGINDSIIAKVTIKLQN